MSGSVFAQSDATRVQNNGQTCFNGYGYTLKGGDYRYTEHHEVSRRNGRITDWNVTYVGRQGQVIARKHMDFSTNPTVPVYEMTVPRTGYEEGIRHQGDTWTMFKRASADAKPQTQNFTIDPPMAADSGFNQLVQQNFSALTSGKTVHFKFAAAGRLSVIDLKASQTGTPTFEGRPAVQFTAKLDMFLVNRFVQSLKLTYDPDTKRLLEYEGIGNIPDDDGDVYPVRVSYYSDMPQVARQHDAPAAACGSVDDNGSG
ncbi:hypothetical protein D3260_06680 [Salinisphaera sp. Q1T1-3]|nr:hypothetical protein D3260_06680 [Salinisphaera sp. Q1T1-3]